MTVRQESRSLAPVQDRYPQLLGALALVGVVTFGTFHWWPFLAAPAMGILFALAGSLTATSLDRVRSPRAFYRLGLRRLLLPLWLFGLVTVPVMIVLGGTVDGPQGPVQVPWSTLWLWVFPLSDPPDFGAGDGLVQPVEFVRTGLWLLLLSPALLWLFRRWPLRVAAVPVVVLVLLASGMLVFDPGPALDAFDDVLIFSCCWLAGLAHHDGMLRRLPPKLVLPAAAALVGAGILYALSGSAPQVDADPGIPPLAEMLYSVGAVLVLLRFRPRLAWMQRIPALLAVLRFADLRGLTVYLWSGFALAVVSLALHDSPLAR
jgi:peptidoglycan/LPS O-acetylase OafA/YrhL